jgi:peptide-methionine (S)-S-oxide reductase
MEKATFAAGCFWGVEAAFRQIDGVIDAVSGYTGGHTANPSYREVCSDTTGHAEAVEITYDPSRVDYERLVNAFWQLHDPTQENRQGPDIGTQYRSAIFVHSPAQEAAARASLAREQANHKRPIATQIVPAQQFFPAEEYHQRYFEKHGRACHISL